jgi:hypothetical protein
MLSQNRFRPVTLSFFGFSRQISVDLRVSPSFILRENRQTMMPTPPAASFCLARIWFALRSSQTRRPSRMCSLSTLLLRSTMAPATPWPQMISPERRSYLQHSLGRMFAEISVDSLGRRDNDRFSRMQTSDQCRRRAAT